MHFSIQSDMCAAKLWAKLRLGRSLPVGTAEAGLLKALCDEKGLALTLRNQQETSSQFGKSRESGHDIGRLFEN